MKVSGMARRKPIMLAMAMRPELVWKSLGGVLLMLCAFGGFNLPEPSCMVAL